MGADIVQQIRKAGKTKELMLNGVQITDKIWNIVVY